MRGGPKPSERDEREEETMLVRVLALVVVALMLTGRTAAQASLSPDQAAAFEYKRLLATTIRYRMAIGEQPKTGGVATVRFTVARSGLVTASSLAGSSGYEDLDQLALAAVAAGTKFPPFPPQMPQDEMKITTPLRYGPR